MEIKVYLVERQKLIRDGIQAFLKEESGINIIGEADHLNDSSLKSVAGCDVLLVEFYGPLDTYMLQVQSLKAKHIALKVILLTSNDSDDLETLRKMLEGGANGYLTKDASREELVHSIRKVMDDGYYVCTAFAMRMIKNTANFKKKSKTIELKKGEQDVLNLIAEGLTNNDIAQRLFVSVRTIETRRRKLLEKTGTSNTATLVRFAVEHQLLT